MPTGTGKTEVALAPMARTKTATLIVAPVRDLMYQWHRRILAAFDYDAGIVGAGLSDIRPITVTTYDSTYIHMDKMGTGFWAPEYLERKRQTLQQFRHHNILIAVPEKSISYGARIGERTLVYKTAIKIEPLIKALEEIRTGSSKS